jgi:hypothetical protein
MVVCLELCTLNTFPGFAENFPVQMYVVWMLIRFDANVTDFSIINRSGVNGCKHYHFEVMIHKLGSNVKHHLCDA